MQACFLFRPFPFQPRLLNPQRTKLEQRPRLQPVVCAHERSIIERMSRKQELQQPGV